MSTHKNFNDCEKESCGNERKQTSRKIWKNDSSSQRNIVAYLATSFIANFELNLILIKPDL